MSVHSNTVPTASITLHGHLYGEPRRTLLERAQQEPPPEIGDIFLADLWATSSILALKPSSTSDEIVQAYGADVKKICQRCAEADEFMLRVLSRGEKPANTSSLEWKTEERVFRKMLEPLNIKLKIAFRAERAAMPPPELVTWLKAEFRAAMDNMARRVSATLHVWADNNVVGVIEWYALDICKFHYLTWSVNAKVATTQERKGDIHAWNELTTTTTSTVDIQCVRHTSHVVKAARHTIEGYKHPMPQHAIDLIADTPAWLKPHLLIVDGTEIFHEKLVTLQDKTTTTEIESVVRYDPAIVLGNFVLRGWKESDIPVTVDVPEEIESITPDEPMSVSAQLHACCENAAIYTLVGFGLTMGVAIGSVLCLWLSER